MTFWSDVPSGTRLTNLSARSNVTAAAASFCQGFSLNFFFFQDFRSLWGSFYSWSSEISITGFRCRRPRNEAYQRGKMHKNVGKEAMKIQRGGGVVGWQKIFHSRNSNIHRGGFNYKVQLFSWKNPPGIKDRGRPPRHSREIFQAHWEINIYSAQSFFGRRQLQFSPCLNCSRFEIFLDVHL